MKQNIKAKDIMTTKPLVLRAEMPIEEAVDLLTEKNTQGAPVLNKTGDLVGFLSVHDVMVDLWCQYYTPNAEQLVSDLMKRDVASIEANETLFNIVELLCIDKKQLYPTSNMGIGTASKLIASPVEERAKAMDITTPQILPVLDNGVLTGVITRMDVLKALRPAYSETSVIDELACA